MITSFGLVYLTESYGYFGLRFVMIPVCIEHIRRVQYFDNLEIQSNDYHPVNHISAECVLQRPEEQYINIEFKKVFLAGLFVKACQAFF